MQRQNTISVAGHGVMLRRAALFFAFVAMLIFAAQAAVGDTTKTRLFLNLTSDDVWSNQMAFGYANKVMADSNLSIVMVDGDDLDRIDARPVAIVDVFSREARHAMDLKKLDP